MSRTGRGLLLGTLTTAILAVALITGYFLLPPILFRFAAARELNQLLHDEGVTSLTPAPGTASWSVPLLVEGLRDEKVTVRQKAAVALGNMGIEARGSIPALIEALRDDDVITALNAATALKQVDPANPRNLRTSDNSTPRFENDRAIPLPHISAFLTQPSDRFLVDLSEITAGHPFKGINSAQPHAGGHVCFDNSSNRWPKEAGDPANYPAIYAVADGIVTRVDTHFPLSGGNIRYGVDLTFARDQAGSTYQFCYSIEPMAPEPSDGFYKKFILVHKGQRVHKGDVIAYLYTPPNVRDSHIHFHLKLDGNNGFFAPAIFRPEIVAAFHESCHGFREQNGISIPPCMGYQIGADENPFHTGPKEQL